MDINDIKFKYSQLKNELISAVSTMSYDRRVISIRQQLLELQNFCPHKDSTTDFSFERECPYCGKKFRGD